MLDNTPAATPVSQPSCIVGETLVSTERGRIRVDELARMSAADEALPLVWSGLFMPPRPSLTKCTRAWQSGEVSKLYKITTGGVTLTCTPEHRLLIAGTQDYVEAQHVEVGARLRSLKEAEDSLYVWAMPVRVTAVEVIELAAPVPVYDLEVEETHNFAVSTSPETSVIIVHNSSERVVVPLREAARESIPVERRFSLHATEYEQRNVIVDFKSGLTINCRVPKTWSDNAVAVLMSKYAVRTGVPDHLGGVNGREVDAERIFDRLVLGWRRAAIEHGYWTELERAGTGHHLYIDIFCAEIKAMLEQQRAAPNSPQWFNTGVQAAYGIKAGSDGHYFATVDTAGHATAHACIDSLAHPQISACFIQSVDDKLVGEGGIMDLWQREARLFKHGSGSGANYSALRGKHEPLSRGGVSSGLLSFLRVGDRSAGAIKSGGTTRRSARIVIVDADHPDIEEFIAWKPSEDAKIRALHAAGIGDPNSFEDEATDTVSGQNANNSVSVTDAFMRAVDDDGPWQLTRRTDGGVHKTLPARDLWNQIAAAAWTCADPGLQFRDTKNEWNTCKADGEIVSVNPCAEYAFLNDTACNLASINLAKFHAPELTSQRCFDWDGYTHAVRLWTIVLDISVSMAGYPTAEIARRSMLYRTLGLGYAALGELLVMRGLGYGTERGRNFAASLTEALTCVAYLTSTELAEKLGAFPRFDANREHVLTVLGKHAAAANTLGGYGPARWSTVIAHATRFGTRNAQVSLLAPAGTIGIVMDCDTLGVEPFFSDTIVKQLAGGGYLKFATKRFAEVLESHGYAVAKHTRCVFTVEGGKVREYQWIDPPSELADVLVCADGLLPEQHIAMMAAVQPFLSGAQSKTVNMSSDVTAADVAAMYELAWRSGLKSIAIYRDGCKPAQPMQGRKPKPGVQTYATREAADAALQASIFAKSTPFDFGVSVHEHEDSDRVTLSYKGQTIETDKNAGAITNALGQFVTPLARGERVDLPASLDMGCRVRVSLSGHTFHLLLTEYPDGSLAEIFVTASRTGSTIAGWVHAWAKTASLALQFGTPLAVLIDAWRGEMFEPTGFHDGRPVLSPIDAFARIIEARYLAPTVQPADVPVPRSAKVTGGACDNCGAFDLTRAGSCFVCGRCGSTTGCS